MTEEQMDENAPEALKARIAELEKENRALEEKVSELGARNTELDEDVGDMEVFISAVLNNVLNVQGEKIKLLAEGLEELKRRFPDRAGQAQQGLKPDPFIKVISEALSGKQNRLQKAVRDALSPKPTGKG